jgi:hypothetical protein
MGLLRLSLRAPKLKAAWGCGHLPVLGSPGYTPPFCRKTRRAGDKIQSSLFFKSQASKPAQKH